MIRRLRDIALAPVARRILRGFGANFLGKVWALIIQLGSVPFLVGAWGADGYGTWVMISTVSAYLTLSDFGIGSAATVEMTRAITREDPRGALRVFQSSWLFMTAATVSIALCVIAGSWVWHFCLYDQRAEEIITSKQISLAVTFICLASLLSLQMSIQKTVFYATQRYAFGTALYDISYLIEGLVVIAIALFGGSIVAAAVAMVVQRVLALSVYTIVLGKLTPWWHMGYRAAEKETLRQILKPSISALALSMATTFGLQGVVLSVGWVMGPIAAAIFATSRMITRIPLQFSALLTRASLPELTRAFESGNRQLSRNLIRANMLLALLSLLPFCVILPLWGPAIISKISHGELHSDSTLMLLMALAAVASAVWSTLGTALVSINRQGVFSWHVLAFYTLCALSPFFLQKELIEVAAFILMSEIIISAVVIFAGRRL